MDQGRKYCKYIFVSTSKRSVIGEMCKRYCRGGGNRCYQHKKRRKHEREHNDDKIFDVKKMKKAERNGKHAKTKDQWKEFQEKKINRIMFTYNPNYDSKKDIAYFHRYANAVLKFAYDEALRMIENYKKEIQK